MRNGVVDFGVLAATYGTPFYFYDLDGALARVREMRGALPDGLRLLYCPKANPNAGVLDAFRGVVDGLDVSSIGEVRLAQSLGYPPAVMNFAGPGKTDAALREAIDRGVGIVSIESEGELQRLSSLARQRRRVVAVTLRINPLGEMKQFAMRMGGQASPFGIPEESAEALLQKALGDDALEVRGIHVYAGTQCLDVDAVAENVRNTSDLAVRLAASTGLRLQLVNLGGGIGIPHVEGEEAVDATAVATAIAGAIVQAAAHPALRAAVFVLELGRYLIGEFGTYVARVVDVKTARGKRFAILDGGMNHCFAATGNFGPIIKRNFSLVNLSRPAGALDAYDVVGPLCTPLDTLARNILLPTIAPGDLVGVLNCGAYGLTASPIRFLGHDLPSEVIHLEGRCALAAQENDYARFDGVVLV